MAKIRRMEQEDAAAVLEMMKVFYESPAVLHDVPQEVLIQDIEACISDLPFLEGLVFCEEGELAGYAMLAKSFSTEFGGVCVWIEDLYLRPEYRGSGIATQFFQYLKERFEGQAVLFKLEVERENEQAMRLYKKCGYEELPYMEMIKKL